MPLLEMYKGENEYSKMVQINETEKLNPLKNISACKRQVYRVF